MGTCTLYLLYRYTIRKVGNSHSDNTCKNDACAGILVYRGGGRDISELDIA